MSASDAVSESESSRAGVATPLSLEIHSSSSPSPELAMVKPALDLPCLGKLARREVDGGWRCSLEAILWLLFNRAKGGAAFPWG